MELASYRVNISVRSLCCFVIDMAVVFDSIYILANKRQQCDMDGVLRYYASNFVIKHDYIVHENSTGKNYSCQIAICFNSDNFELIML